MNWNVLNQKSNNELVYSVNKNYSLDVNSLQAYASVLTGLQSFIVNYYENMNKPLDEPWSSMRELDIESYKLGYSMKDLNGNGIPELILMAKDKASNDYCIRAIYSIVDGKPKLLDTFHHRNRCYIDKDSFIYIEGSSGASESIYQKCKIKSDGTGFQIIEEIKAGIIDNEPNVKNLNEENQPLLAYYKTKENVKTQISKEEFESILNEMPQDNKNCNLEFIHLKNPLKESKKKSGKEDLSFSFDILKFYYGENLYSEMPLDSDRQEKLSKILKGSGSWTEVNDRTYSQVSNCIVDCDLISFRKGMTFQIIGDSSTAYIYVRNNKSGYGFDRKFIASGDLSKALRKFIKEA